MGDEEIGAVGPCESPAGGGVARPAGGERRGEIRLAAAGQRQARAGERAVGRGRQALGERGDGGGAGGGDLAAMLGHARLEGGQPAGIGRRLAEQLVARPHRRLVAGGVAGMVGPEREHEPIEEAAAAGSGVGEQPVHGRRQPEHREPVREAVRRGRGAVDSDLAALGRGRGGAGADVDAQALPIKGRGQSRRHRESAPPAPPRHLAEARTAQASSGREQRHRLEQIGLAGPVLAGEDDEARAGRDDGVGIGAEIAEAEAGDGHAPP